MGSQDGAGRKPESQGVVFTKRLALSHSRLGPAPKLSLATFRIGMFANRIFQSIV
jgi:hypothetical protein